MKRAGAVAIAAVVGWYALALAVLYPLADGPVADSWIYGEAARWFRVTGEFRFPGYTEAMPVAQVIYGAAWGVVFGTGPISFELANVFLAVVTAIMMYALARRCGAREWQALGAAGLLICNPCYLFLSFSFMSEISFLAALVACHLSLAKAVGEKPIRWLWLSAACGVAAFAVRPFGGAAILGSGAAILVYDTLLPGRGRARTLLIAKMLTPFALGLLVCAAIWFWLTVVRTPPWKLTQHQSRLVTLLKVPLAEYVRSGVIGPLLYLGIVLSPLALLRLDARDAGRVIALGAGIFAVTIVAVWAGDILPSTPEMSCFGGWSNALLLRGLPNRFLWQDGWRWVMALLGSIGAAGLSFAAIAVIPKLNRAAAAVAITVGIYWGAMLPLWLFNDRYDLVLVPAGALILALAPLPQKRTTKLAALAMTAAMGLMSLGGTYSYQRGLAAVIAARDVLVKKGIPRAAIDAGYELNGLELYRFARRGEVPMREEAAIPMITSKELDEYTIASQPLPGTTIIGRAPVPGLFGLGQREIYILQRAPQR